MLPNMKLATAIGAILWILIFMAATVLMFGVPQIDAELALLFVNPILILGVAYPYFKSLKFSARTAVLAGAYWTVIGIALDLLITIPLFVKDFGFFLRPLLWTGYAEAIIFVLIGAKVFGKKNR